MPVSHARYRPRRQTQPFKPPSVGRLAVCLSLNERTNFERATLFGIFSMQLQNLMPSISLSLINHNHHHNHHTHCNRINQSNDRFIIYKSTVTNSFIDRKRNRIKSCLPTHSQDHTHPPVPTPPPPVPPMPMHHHRMKIQMMMKNSTRGKRGDGSPPQKQGNKSHLTPYVTNSKSTLMNLRPMVQVHKRPLLIPWVSIATHSDDS